MLRAPIDHGENRVIEREPGMLNKVRCQNVPALHREFLEQPHGERLAAGRYRI